MVGGIYGYASAYNNLNYGIMPVDRISRVGSQAGSSVEQVTNSAELKALKRSGIIECETCENRKYQDGSDEMVSFKSAAHVDPSASGNAVRSHEQEHVANAYKDASQNNGEVQSANVKLKTATCPECGRSYVSGGTTTTQIKYNESNPYEKRQKQYESEALAGQFIDMSA